MVLVFVVQGRRTRHGRHSHGRAGFCRLLHTAHAQLDLVTKWAWLSKSGRGQKFSLVRERMRTTYSQWPYWFNFTGLY